MRACIPQKTLRKQNNVPWLNSNTVRYIRLRNNVFQSAKRSGKSKDFAKFKKLRNRVVQMMRSSKKEYFKKINLADKKSFWKAIKFLSKKQISIPELHHQGQFAKTKGTKVEMLNNFFGSCFNSSISTLTAADIDLLHSNAPSDDLLCTPSQIEALITALDPQKASGPDGISVKMLKATATSIAPSIAKLFNISIDLATFPQSWKISSVVPIPKSKKQLREAASYRPISLLSVVSKLLERHLYLLADYLYENDLLSNKQWGFQHGKSTVTALLHVTNQWFQLLEEGQEVCAVFFDIRKAFDTVPHRPLLNKLCSIGIDSKIIQWICSYLTERRQHVVCDGASSSNIHVLSGVPQGSVLGPLLFLLYIDDVASQQLSVNCMINLFADDMLLFKPVNSALDLHRLQGDIDTIKAWADGNHLSFNPVKCKCMLISRKRRPRQQLSLSLGGNALEQVHTFKYLGVLISSSLSWSPHIDAVCTKARQLLGLLYRRFYGLIDTKGMTELYRALIRPHLEYAVPVWAPHLAKDIDKLEKVQKFGLKICLKSWDNDYYDLLELADLPTLENRRMYLKLSVLYKIYYGHFYFPPGILLPYRGRHSSPNSPCLHVPSARTNAYHNSFFPSTIRIWNQLPSWAHAESLNLFKHFVSLFFV